MRLYGLKVFFKYSELFFIIKLGLFRSKQYIGARFFLMKFYFQKEFAENLILFKNCKYINLFN